MNQDTVQPAVFGIQSQAMEDVVSQRHVKMHIPAARAAGYLQWEASQPRVPAVLLVPLIYTTIHLEMELRLHG